MALKVPKLPTYESREGIRNAGYAGPVARQRDASEFLSLNDKMLAPALQDLSQGLGQLGQEIHADNILKREKAMDLQLLKDLQDFQAASLKYYDDYTQSNRGQDAAFAEQAGLAYYDQGLGDLKKKWAGNQRAQLFIAQHGGPLAISGINSFRDYGNQEMASWEDSTMLGDQAEFKQLASDPRNTPETVAAGGRQLMGRQYAYYRGKGLDHRAAAVEAENLFRNGLRDNIMNRAMNSIQNNQQALWAYNWGLGNVDSFLKTGKGKDGRAMPAETLDYARSVLADYQIQKGGLQRKGGQLGKQASLTAPVAGYNKISSAYGHRNTGIAGASTFHEAVDIPAPIGTPVSATIGGTVKTATNKGKNGNYIVIEGDDGREHYFLHLNNFAEGLKPGDRVEQGMEIGAVGNTGTLKIGPHLDYRIKENGQFVDPEPFLSGGGQAAVTAESGPGGGPVILAENKAGSASDVASDAFGVGAPDHNAEKTPEAPGPAADFSDDGDWIFGDDAALAYEFLSDGDRRQLWEAYDKAESKAFLETNKVRLINGELPEVQAELAQMLRDDKITAETFEQASKGVAYVGEQGVRDAVRAEERAYDEKYYQLYEQGMKEASQPEFLSVLKDSGLYQRDQDFIQSLVIGQTDVERKANKPYRDRAENLVRQAIIEGDATNHRELQRLMSTFTGLFNFEDAEKYRKWLDTGLGDLGKRADEWLDINLDALQKVPAYDKAKNETAGKKIRDQIKSRAVRAAAAMGVGRDDPRFDQIMSKMVTETDEKGQSLYLAAQPDLRMWGLARDDHKDDLVMRKLEQSAEEQTNINKLRAQQALEKNQPLGAVMAPGIAEKWRGRGEIKISGLGSHISNHRDIMIKAGNAHGVDPEFLASFAYSVWRALPYEERTSGNGLLEMSPEEAVALGVADPKNPEDNIRALARRIAERLEAGGGDYDRVIDELIQDEKARKYCRLTYQKGRAPGVNEL